MDGGRSVGMDDELTDGRKVGLDGGRSTCYSVDNK